MELLEALNHLYLLAFSLSGREISAKKLLKDSLAYSDRFAGLLAQKGTVLLNKHEIEELETFLFQYFEKEHIDKDISKTALSQNHSFFKLSAQDRFKLAKYKIESQEQILLLKRDFVESIILLGSDMKLDSFQKVDREQSDCVLTRTALIRLLQTKDIISFKEHTSVCTSCYEFEKQFQKDMNCLKREIPQPNKLLTEEELEDLIFQFQYPTDDYAYLAMHKLKKIGKKFFNQIS
jgi:hypothetical protein